MPFEISDVDRHYHVVRKLGEGLTGEVFLVECPEGRFALKLLKPFPDRRLEESIISAFKFEFGFLKDLNHPNVVRIQDFGFDEAIRRFYFTEEFLEGKTINDYCEGASSEEIGRLFIQAIHGLQAIHRAHILHGDLKGSNLLVIEEDSGPRVKIIDLGLSDPRFPLTAGTPSTMAPEKILKDPVDERSDLYSLGIVFYHLFTGENPFVRDDVSQTYEAQLTFRAPKITLKDPKIPLFWNEIFETLLAKNPAHRFRSCADLLEAIDFARPGRGEARKKVRHWRPERWIGRKKILEDLTQKIRAALSSSEIRSKVFLLLGEAGSGKSRIAQEVKYLFQMEKVKTFESKSSEEKILPSEGDRFSLWIIDEWARFRPPQQAILLKRLTEAKTLPVVLITLLPDSADSVVRRLEEGGAPLLIHLPPFSQEELSGFLKEITDLNEVPVSFLNAFWEKTHGNPKLVISLLERLVAQNRIVDEHGQWNLAIFKEGAFDFRTLDLDLSEIDQALITLPAADHQSRSELWLKRTQELLKKNLIEEAAEALQAAEQEIHGIGELSTKLHFRSRLYEKEGWKFIREGRFEEARNRLERALALLEESTVSDEVLGIRIENFIAWLLCQEGKIDEAITLFERQQRRWEKLSLEDQGRILNNDLGYAYLLKGDVNRAVFFLEQGLAFSEKVQDAASQMKGLYNLAEAYVQGKNYSKAIQYYLKTAELARLHRNFELLLRAYNGLGKTHHLQGSFNEGMAYYERALELARYLEDYSSAAAIAQNIGSIQSERGDFDPAKEHFDLALKLLKKLGEPNAHAKYLQCRALLEMGDLARKRKKFEEAQNYVRDAHQLALQEPSLSSFRFWVLYTQCQIEKDEGNLDKLQDLMADLLHFADDADKRERCRDLMQTLPLRKTAAPQEVRSTRIETIRPTADPQVPSETGAALRSLIRVARWMAGEKDPDRLLPLIIRQAAELSGAEAGVILLAEGPGRMTPKASVNLTLEDSIVQMSESLAERVLATGEAVCTGEALADERFKVYESVIDFHLQSILALPILSENRILGVLALMHRYRANAFADLSLDLMKAFADQAGIALETARLVAGLEEAKKRLSQDLDATHEELEKARQNLSESSVLVRFAEQKLISRNKKMSELFQMVERLRDTDLSIFLRGESGTGKELLARSIHRTSRRGKAPGGAPAPFVAVNCAALPPTLIESELFGFRAGAFTGAVRDKKGLIQEAQGGTLFLDEIAELDLTLQAKLLRVLQEKEITRLGDTRPIPVDFRLLSASHQNLKERAGQGRFREDLYYRICELELFIPPLRDRREDIPLLAEEFIRQYLEEHGEKGKIQLGRDLLKTLMDYSWPGNVREFENLIRVASALRKGSVLHVGDLPDNLREQLGQKTGERRQEIGQVSLGMQGMAQVSTSSGSLFDPKKKWEEIELVILAKALLRFDFDVKKAAESLGCAVTKLYQRMRESDLKNRRGEFEAHPFVYGEGILLDEVKKRVFAEALKYSEESPYQAAKILGVSPGMVYKWTATNPISRTEDKNSEARRVF